MKFKIFKFSRVRSTNDTAISLIKNKKKLSGCVYAAKQTKGRGTRGAKWVSGKGNLFGSIFFHLEKKYPPFNEFSIINPIIISNVIKHFCKNKKINLKFPNDIFVNGKKICGILQEVITFNNKKFLIIGIGVNIINHPNLKNNYKTTNIFAEVKKKISLNKVQNLLISSYEKFFKEIGTYNYKNYRKKAHNIALN
jgi:BirA family transcriptional regulator, biotin operon repressor / biotin---[acetyl-CoA-carboxylase] ligase